jgi:hypothetical protein
MPRCAETSGSHAMAHAGCGRGERGLEVGAMLLAPPTERPREGVLGETP